MLIQLYKFFLLIWALLMGSNLFLSDIFRGLTSKKSFWFIPTRSQLVAMSEVRNQPAAVGMAGGSLTKANGLHHPNVLRIAHMGCWKCAISEILNITISYKSDILRFYPQ